MGPIGDASGMEKLRKLLIISLMVVACEGYLSRLVPSITQFLTLSYIAQLTPAQVIDVDLIARTVYRKHGEKTQ